MNSERKPRGSLAEAAASDAALLARVAQGEVSAMGALYDRHAPALLRFAKRVDPQDAEDLLHITFVRVATLSTRFDGRSPSARAWLFAIITRVAQERTRSLRRFARAIGRLSDMPRRQSVSINDTRRDLDRALSALSTPKRAVLLLAEVEGFSCEEIATMLGIPIGTVWTRLHHARKELRALHGEMRP
jgi:RNA polymerase sigma factor (sigma-70 family)